MGWQYNPDTGDDEWADDPVIQQTAAPVTAAPVVQTPVTSAPVYGSQGGYWYDDGGDSYWYDTATGQSDYNGPQAVAATSATVAQTPVAAAPVTQAPYVAPVTQAPVTQAPYVAPVAAAGTSLYDQLEAAGLSWVNDYLSLGDMSEDEAWGYLNPVTQAPYVAPVTSAPVTSAPVTSAPVTAAPVTAAPVTTASVTTTRATPAATYEYDDGGDYVGSGGGYDKYGNPSPEQAALDAQWQQDYINHTRQWAPTGQAAIDTGMSWAAPVTADAGLASLQALGNPLGTTGNSYLAAAGAALPSTVATTPDAATGALPAGYGGRPVLTGNAGSGYTTGQDIPLGMMLNPAYGSPALDTREHGYLVGPAHSLDAPQFIEDPNYIPPIEEVPMPEVLAKNGHEVVPIYNTKSTGFKNATQNYGKPIGYYYDNGNSTYVITDAAGNITGEKARTDEWTSFREGLLKPAAAIIAAVYGAPYLSDALGAGAAAAPTNAALIDSAVGTAGYGVSSATVASGMAGTLGMSAGPLATAVNTAFANGGMEAVREVVSKEGLDLNKILASAGRGAITSGATSLVSNAVNSAGIDVGNTTVNNLINKGLTTATVASIMGGDWKKALVGMGLNEAAGLVAKQIPGFDKLPKEVQSVVTSTIGTGLSGGNMSDAALQNAINMGIKVGADSGAAWLKDLVPKDAVNAVTNVLKKAGLQENAGSVLTTTTTDATGTDTTGYDAVNALQTAGLTEDTSGNGGPDVDLSRTVVPTDYVAYKPGTIGYSDIRDKWMEAANGSPAGFEAFAKDLKNSGFTANQIALAMGISPESAQAALNYKAPIAPRTEVTTAFDSSGIKALNDKYVADTNALNKLYSTDPAGFLAYMGTMGIDPTNFSDMDSYMGWPTGTSETLIPPVIAAQTAATDNITNPDLAATDWEKLYAEGADKSTSQEGYPAQDFGVTLSGDTSTASGFVPYIDPDTGSPTGDMIYTADDGSTITLRQDGSVEATPSPTIDPMYTLDPVAVTAAGTGVEGGDQYLGVDTTDQNVLDPVTVIGTKDTVLDPVTVTGTKDTVLDPVTVTGTKDTVLDPVTVTGTKDTVLDPVTVIGTKDTPAVVTPTVTPKVTITPKVTTPITTPKVTTPQSVPQYLQQTNYTPTKTELADIKTLFNAFGPSIFQMLKAGMTPEQILQYTEYGETPESIMDALGIAPSPEMAAAPEPASENPIYAAQGGSIDDLIEYLRS